MKKRILIISILSILFVMASSVLAFAAVDMESADFQAVMDSAAPATVPAAVLDKAEEGLELLKYTYENDPLYFGFDSNLDVNDFTLGDTFYINDLNFDGLSRQRHGDSLVQDIDTRADVWFFFIDYQGAPTLQMEIYPENDGGYIVGPFGGDSGRVSNLATTRAALLDDLTDRAEHGSEVGELVAIFVGPEFHYYSVIDGKEVIAPSTKQVLDMEQAQIYRSRLIEPDSMWYPAEYFVVDTLVMVDLTQPSLTIDEATDVDESELLALSAAAPTYKILGVRTVLQAPYQKLCWAASGASVVQYMGKSCTISSFAVSVKGNFYDQTAYTSEIAQGIRNYGYSATYNSSTPSYVNFKDEIGNQEKPIVASYAYTSGGAHAVVMEGYNDSTQVVHYMDPLQGKLSMGYNDFKNNSRWYWQNCVWKIR